MARARVVRRVGLGLVLLVTLLVVAVAVVATGVVRQSWPQTTGEIRLSGLGGRVEVVRDGRGTPQIYADSADDLFRAQGFVAAQDRFFEMDFRRHVTAGRLSELVGASGLETDKVVRTLGWRSVAEQELGLLSPSTRAHLNAYADGVNDYIGRAGSPSDMGLEYAVLARQVPGYTVERWSAVDSLAWLKALAWDLKANYGDELTRARLGSVMAQDRLAVLYPEYAVAGNPPILAGDEWSPGTLPAASSAPAALTTAPAGVGGPPAPMALTPPTTAALFAGVQQALEAVPALVGRGEGVGSNSWVVSGARSTTGKPLLANDPHLATSIPGIWYQTGLHCRTVSDACPFDVSGFSFAGVPGIIIGHNGTVAWGLTNLGSDVTDFYLEKVTDSTYLRDGQQVPLEVSNQTIKVAGGNDVRLTVRRTVHGPIVSDVLDSVGRVGRNALVRLVPQQDAYAVSLAWTGLVPSPTADAIFGLDTAKSFTDFRAAAAKFAAPAQNMVYADTAGHIGYQAPGLTPVRSTSVPNTPPGYWPAPGWDSQYDWKGFVPFDQLPWAYDPPEGMVVTANNQVTAATGATAPFLTTDWDFGWRSGRIEDLLKKTDSVSPEQMAQIQNDTYNAFAPSLVQSLLQIDLSGDEFTQQAQQLLGDWDFTQPAAKGPASVRAAYFNAVWTRVVDYTFNDELPQDLKADGGGRYMAAMLSLLKDPTNAWWDDRRTPGVVESRDEILRKALVQARLDLAKHLGKDPATWTWGELHTATVKSQVLGGDSVPSVVQKIFNRGPLPLGGGPSIVNANSWDAASGTFDVTRGPSMRMVVDLGNLDASTWVNQTGNSGHPYSAHYVDQLDAWATGEQFPWAFGRGAVDASASETLVLSPQG